MGIFTNEDGGLNCFRTLSVAFLAVFFGISGCGTVMNNYDYSSGARAGMVNKMSRKGLLWKTYEGQMALEGIVSDGQSSGANVWDFSIDNQARHGENVEELQIKLNNALELGQKVKIKYFEVYIGGWPWRGSTNHYVQSVEPIVVKAEKQ